MKVEWTDTAVGHLSAIYDYIALDAEEYAKRMVDRLTRRSEQIDVLAVIHGARILTEEMINIS